MRAPGTRGVQKFCCVLCTYPQRRAMRDCRAVQGLFARAELTVTLTMKQKDMPEQLYPVKMYVVRPRGAGSE